MGGTTRPQPLSRTGTRTILTQIAADSLGLPMESVTAESGDSTLPPSPVEGGSWTAASAGSAVSKACEDVREKLFGHARRMTNSPLADAAIGDVLITGPCYLKQMQLEADYIRLLARDRH